MTTRQLKQTILAEIERRIRELDEQIVDIYDSKAVLRKDELQKLISFINSLPDEASAVGTVDTTARPKNIIVKTEDWEALFEGFENGEKAIITISKEAAK